MIRRSSRRTTYTVLDNALIEDKRLSWRTMGVLTYLLSRPDNWQAQVRHLSSLREDGDYAIRQSLKELEEAGYLVRRRERDKNGRWQWVQVIYECPGCEQDDESTVTRFPTHGESREDANTHSADSRTAKIAQEQVLEVTTTEVTSEPDGSRAPDLNWKIPEVVATGGFLEAAVELCDLWAERLENREVRVGKRARSKAWVVPMEALLRIDGREPWRVQRVINWLEDGKDEVSIWWQPNVMCPSKLREKWDQMAQQFKRQGRQGHQGRSGQAEAAKAIADDIRNGAML